MKIIQGGITAAKGYSAYGAHVGVKRKRKDLALIVSEVPALYSGTFTTNVVKAAPVIWNMDIYKHKHPVKAIVVNSGNANACTGDQGDSDNERMAITVAECLGIEKNNVLVGSTGVIGVELPIEKIIKGIEDNISQVKPDYKAGLLAAEAICTTDTFSKEVAVEIEISGKTVRIGGMAKGSGMIHPNMATMLSYVTTDVAISFDMLDQAVKESVEDAYNMISVDGDTSTNDMCTVIANGMAGNDIIVEEHEDYLTFKKALDYVNKTLAKLIVKDGEGASKFIEVNIYGTRSKKEAQALAMSVVTSNLVKTAFFGNDANWGRVLCAMGYSGVKFDAKKVTLKYESSAGTIDLMVNGVPQKFDEERAFDIIKEKEVTVNAFLEEGTSKGTAWGCDLSYEYVKINGEYRT
jgi:glutamate N-acetyltransferase/amino-acid N-acetyltransferase